MTLSQIIFYLKKKQPTKKPQSQKTKPFVFLKKSCVKHIEHLELADILK